MLKKVIKILPFLMYSLSLFSQQCPQVLMNMDYSEVFANIDNRIEILGRQSECILKENLEIFYCRDLSDDQCVSITFTGSEGSFIIHPDSVGILRINIRLGNEIIALTRQIKPLKAEIYLSGHTRKYNKTIGIKEMRTQGGIAAIVDCCDFELSCKIVEFDILRISSDDIVNRVWNKGPRFNELSRDLINSAESGDLYIFKKIRYRCLEEGELIEAEDLIVEVR